MENKLEEAIKMSQEQWKDILAYVENTDSQYLPRDQEGFFNMHDIKAVATPQVRNLRSHCWFCDYVGSYPCMQSCPLAHVTGHICTHPGNLYYQLTEPITEKVELLKGIKAFLSTLLKIRVVFSTEEELTLSFKNELFFYSRKDFPSPNEPERKFRLLKRETSHAPKDPIDAFQKTLRSWKKVFSYVKKTRLENLPELIDAEGRSKLDIAKIKALADPAVKEQKSFCYLCSYALSVNNSIMYCNHRCIIHKLIGRPCASPRLKHTNTPILYTNTKKELLRKIRTVIKSLEEVKFAPLIRHKEGDIVSCTYRDTHYLILLP